MRILTPVELKEQRLRVSTREHERIMDMLLENEAAIEKVTPPLPPRTLPNANTSLGASMRVFLSELGRIAPSNSNVDGRGVFRSGACRLTARRLAWSKSTACSWTRLC